MNIVDKLITDSRINALVRSLKLTVLVAGSASALGYMGAAVVGLPATSGLLALGLASLPIAGWLALNEFKMAKVLLLKEQANLVKNWLEVGSASERANKARIYAEGGLAAALAAIEPDFARSVRVVSHTKARRIAKTREVLATKAGAAIPTPEPMWLSGNGLPISNTGTDVLGDVAGSTSSRDFLSASCNPNTGEWSTSGSYTPPV